MSLARAIQAAGVGLIAYVIGNSACVRDSADPGIAQSLEKRDALFQDVTDSAGIDFVHRNGDAGKHYFPEIFGGGCAFLDFDQDGWLDILLLSCGEIALPEQADSQNMYLYRNNGDGTFRNITRGSGLERPLGYMQAVAVGDYDNDSRPDVFVAGYAACYLFRNESTIGTARFSEIAVASGLDDRDQGAHWASGAAWGDYNRDGRLDIILIRYARWSVESDVSCRRSDGRPNYCVPTIYDGDANRLFLNHGGGRFQDVSGPAGISNIRARSLGVAWTDFDQDGDSDLFIANDLDPNHLLRNNDNGTFSEVAAESGVALGGDGIVASGMGIALGDYDHSGRESIIVTNIKGERYSLFQNSADGTFDYATDSAGLSGPTRYRTGWGTAFLDFDRDGWLDLIAANGGIHPYVERDMAGVNYQEPKSLFRNIGGEFREVTTNSPTLRTPKPSRGLAVGDFDNDGRPDLLIVNRNGRAELLRNIEPSNHRFVTLRLVGRHTVRDGAGAKVTLESGRLRQFTELRLSSSYASSSDPRLTFGLADAPKVDRVTVRWPSGVRDVCTNLEPNRFYVVEEGGGCRVDERPSKP